MLKNITDLYEVLPLIGVNPKYNLMVLFAYVLVGLVYIITSESYQHHNYKLACFGLPLCREQEVKVICKICVEIYSPCSYLVYPFALFNHLKWGKIQYYYTEHFQSRKIKYMPKVKMPTNHYI